MMLLLDTHIWIWTHLEPWNISSEVTNELASPRNELWLSPLSIWELVLLVEKKRLDLNADMGEWVQQSMKNLRSPGSPVHICGGTRVEIYFVGVS
jgi:PIN domain nuclease of toxin-antitoxin system